MSKAVYSLKNLWCSYEGNAHPSLIVDELAIGQGDVTFVVGASGCGKSTLLETLGLMNNTAERRSEMEFSILLPKWHCFT